MLNAKDGRVYGSLDVGSDGVNETADDCGALAGGCRQLKNALQADPVTTGRGSQRFITTAYLGDLDGSVWRVNLQLDASLTPMLSALTRIYPATAGAADQPIFNSMATTSDGANQYVFFGTGSDLLPSTGADTAYHFIGINDNGTLPSPKQIDIALAKQGSPGVGERISAFPAIAGDTGVLLRRPQWRRRRRVRRRSRNLYAVTFTGGPAYDTNKDHLLNSNDSATLAEVVARARPRRSSSISTSLRFRWHGCIVRRSIRLQPWDRQCRCAYTVMARGSLIGKLCNLRRVRRAYQVGPRVLPALREPLRGVEPPAPPLAVHEALGLPRRCSAR